MAENNQQDAFLQLFISSEARIYAYLRTLVFSDADAEELLQEVASILWRKFDTFERGTHFDRWAIGVAHHQAQAFRRQKGREHASFSPEVLDRIADHAARENAEAEELNQALRNCVAGLAMSDRDLLTMRYEPGVTNRDLAQRLTRSESAISRSLNRIYTTLLKCINATRSGESSPSIK